MAEYSCSIPEARYICACGNVYHAPFKCCGQEAIALPDGVHLMNSEDMVELTQRRSRERIASVCWHCRKQVEPPAPSNCEACPPHDGCTQEACTAPGCQGVIYRDASREHLEQRVLDTAIIAFRGGLRGPAFTLAEGDFEDALSAYEAVRNQAVNVPD
jgi:hypothetical protein